MQDPPTHLGQVFARDALLGFETLASVSDPSLPEELFTDLNSVRVQPHWHRREAQLGSYR
jgi:hypothetical protein